MLNIVLYQPEIPVNTGNIMRTCVATNTTLHLIKPLGFSLSDSAIKRSGVNYINDCKYYIYDNLADFFEKNNGMFYYLTRYGHKPHSGYTYNEAENIYFIFGKESSGLPLDLLKANIKQCIRIPMSNKVRALNLSNSVAIVLYEALRQQQYLDLLKNEPHKGENFLEEL